MEGQSTKKRERDNGFDSPAAKIASELSAKLCGVTGQTLQDISETLQKCKTLKDFKKARVDINQISVNCTVKYAQLTLEMCNETQKLK